MKRLIGALLCSALVMPCVTGAQARDETPTNVETTARPWMNPRLSPGERADLLLAAMTLDEKIAMLHGPMAMPLSPTMPMPAGAVRSAGYIAGNPRLGIPALQETDASLGVTNPMMVRGAKDMSTALPSGMALAATFNPDLAFAGGRMIGGEARAKGLNVLLAGGVNLARDPRNGRNFEYVGEDPLLAGVLTGESVRGIESTGMVSTVKHYALNGQEHNRNTVDSQIGEQAMRESDLLAFQIAIERGKPGSVMCSYNLVNGQHACQNDLLLNTILKRDWRFPIGVRYIRSTRSTQGSTSNRGNSSMRRSGSASRSSARSRRGRSAPRASTMRSVASSTPCLLADCLTILPRRRRSTSRRMPM